VSDSRARLIPGSDGGLELFEVAFENLGCGLSSEGLQTFEQLPWIETIYMMLIAVVIMWVAVKRPSGGGDNHADAGDDLPQALDEGPTSSAIVHGCVDHHSVNMGKTSQRCQRFLGVIRGDDVQLGAFNHQLSGGDAPRIVAIDDDEAWPIHLMFDARCQRRGAFYWLVPGLLLADPG